MALRVLGLIAARGGSKTLPRKNLVRLEGKPLLEYAASAARASSKVERVILTTDDEEIASLGRSLDIEVPFMRPPELAADLTPLRDVLIHALDYFRDNEGIEYDALVSLDPTAPFKIPDDIDRCVEAMEQGATSANTACEAEVNPYYNMLVADSDFWATPLFEEYHTLTRRQDAPVVYRENGVVQAALTSEIRAGNWPVTDKCKLIVMPQSRSVVIDYEAELALAQVLAPRFLAGELT